MTRMKLLPMWNKTIWLPKVALIALLGSVLLFSGCTSIQQCKGAFNQSLPHADIISALPIEEHINAMSKELYPAYGGGNMVVTDFIDTNNYHATSAGVLMGEMLKTSVARNTNARVLQLDFAKSFKLSPTGMTVLTRDAQKRLKSRLSASIALVGSYNISSNSLYLFVKRINIRTGSVIHSVSRKLTFSCFGDIIVDTTRKVKPIVGQFNTRNKVLYSATQNQPKQ